MEVLAVQLIMKSLDEPQESRFPVLQVGVIKFCCNFVSLSTGDARLSCGIACLSPCDEDVAVDSGCMVPCFRQGLVDVLMVFFEKLQEHLPTGAVAEVTGDLEIYLI